MAKRLCQAALIIVSLFPSLLAGRADGTAVYRHDPSKVFVSPGLSFFTTLGIKTRGEGVGACSLVVNYDTNALQIERIVAAPGSGFANNLFVDAGTFQSGSTRIVAFQATAGSPPTGSQAVCYIVWRTVGQSSRLAQITTTIEKHVSQGWQTTQLWSTPASIAIDSTDTDEDGLPDWWEQRYFQSPTAVDPTADADLDGYSNLQEFRAGTSPLDASQVVRIAALEFIGTDVRLEFPTLQLKSYQVEWSDDVSRIPWTPLGDVIPGTGNPASALDERALTHAIRFYRVRIIP